MNMSKIPSRSNTNTLRIDLKIVQLLVNTEKNLKLYIKNALHGPGKRRHARMLDVRSLLIFSLILMLGIGIGIQGMVPARSANAPGPVENMRTGMTYSTIQAAINDASTIAGDTIQVNSGTYHENVVISKSIILKGLDTGNGLPVVDGSGVNSAITISANGVTLRGFAATDANYGIYVMSNNNNITGNMANNNNNDGIVFHSSNQNSITGNTANNNGNASEHDADGLLLENSNYNTLSGNTVKNNNYGNGIELDSSNNNVISGNTANNNFLSYNINDNFGIYLWGSSNNSVTGNTANSNTYGIFLDGWGNTGSNYNTVSGNTANNNYYGILVDDSFYNTVSGNTANNNNIDGIFLQDSSKYNNIVNNTVTGNDASGEPGGGICFDQSFYNSATGNTVNNNNDGFFLMDSSSNNNITGNTANNNNNDGIELKAASNNNVAGNTVKNNGFGIYLSGSNGNVFWLNVLQGNSYKNAVVSDGSSNTWNSPTKLQYTYNGQAYTNYNGNYWSDGQWAGQTNGIENTAYTISDNNIDHYPMVLAGSPITPTATPTATPSPGQSSFTLNLKSGWNLVGWCSLKSLDASTVSGTIPGSQVIARYNATSGGYDPYVEGYSPAKDSFVLQPGVGYFIESDSAQNLNFGVF